MCVIPPFPLTDSHVNPMCSGVSIFHVCGRPIFVKPTAPKNEKDLMCVQILFQTTFYPCAHPPLGVSSLLRPLLFSFEGGGGVPPKTRWSELSWLYKVYILEKVDGRCIGHPLLLFLVSCSCLRRVSPLRRSPSLLCRTRWGRPNQGKRFHMFLFVF